MEIVRKALIYGRSASGLLVFEEPDFPEVPVQVPGGTVDPGESVHDAARREFNEETGLYFVDGFRYLGKHSHVLERQGTSLTVERSFFYRALPDGLPPQWHHYERHPAGGGPPILFRLFWLNLAEARRRLAGGLDAFLHLLD